MLLECILTLYENDDLDINEQLERKTITEEHYILDDMIAICIEELASFYDKEQDCIIKDETGNKLGYICFDREVESITAFTNPQKVAYLRDINYESYMIQKYKISKSYVVLYKENYETYMDKYYGSAPIWGNFSHKRSSNSAFTKDFETVVASEINLPTSYHSESIMRAIQQPYAFERFLKKYHLLELLFDYDFVKEISELGEDLRGLNIILKELNQRDEISRLTKVLYKRKDKIDFIKLADLLNNVKSFKDTAINIFFEYGKSNNPISSQKGESPLERFNKITLESEPFEYNKLKGHVNGMNTIEKYNKMLLDISTYWIYRVRCSIAHFKIGEYLIGYEDEEFIVEFIEPILQLLVKDCFKI